MRIPRRCIPCCTTETVEVTPENSAAGYPCWLCREPTTEDQNIALISRPGPCYDVPASKRRAS